MILPVGKNNIEVDLVRGRGFIFTRAVSINGRNAGVFIIDTGSNVSIIDKEKAAVLGLHKTLLGMSEIEDMRKFNFYRLESLRIGGVELKNHWIYSTNAAKAYGKFNEPVVGVLGGDVLGKLPFKLDLSALKWTFYRRASFKPQGPFYKLKQNII